MADVPNEELNKALDLWLYIQATQPAWAADYIKRHAGRNPFDPWPPQKERVDDFLRIVNDSLFHDSSPERLPKTIDPKKREEMVETFNKEYDKVKSAQTAAEISAKSRVQDVIRHALENKDVAPNQKGLLFQVLKNESDREPTKSVDELVPQAIAVGEAAQAFINPEIENEAKTFIPRRFRDLKGLTGTQKAVTAPLLDAFTDVATSVFPGLKQGVMNKSLAFALEDLLKKTDNLTRIFGQNVVNEPWYKRVIQDAGQIIAQGKSAGGAKTVIDDIASSLFYGPTSQTMMAYIQVVQINLMQGKPIPNANQFMAANMGFGAGAFSVGSRLLVRQAETAALRGFLARVGLESLVPGLGWAVALFDIGRGLLGKAVSFFTGLQLPSLGLVPGDKEVFGIGCGAILLFVLILPLINQLNIDSALYGRFGGNNQQGGGPSVDCSTTPNAPECKFTACVGDCKWPASGNITQGPFTAGVCPNNNMSSHVAGNAANGIDIAGGGPIYTPRAGTVIEAYTACANNSGRIGDTCGGNPAYRGYGNHVIVKTDDGYTLIFGHMESAMGVKTGDHVAAGAQLGWMDQTGNSTGTHLHFGVLSGGSVLDFVPKGDPAAEAISGCISDSRCHKMCPSTPVHAGTGQ